MTGDAASQDGLDAGDFTTWLGELRAALRGDRDAEVPCGDCTACCTSSQFVHIAPDEVDTLAHIPRELAFPAPGLPDGHVLLGYDRDGRCPMLVEGACSIYEHRPRTCRTYDCRVFPAVGLTGEPMDKPAIADRAARWRFRSDEAGRIEQEAAVTAGTFLTEHRAELPTGAVPSSPTQLAAVALGVAAAFTTDDEQGRPRRTSPTVDAVVALLSHEHPPTASPNASDL